MNRIRMVLTLSLILLNAALISLKAQTPANIDTTRTIELRLDLRSALSEEVFPGDIFDTVEYIPLETNKKSLFNSIDQLEITDQFYIILDRAVSQINTKVESAVLIFRKDGTFHAKISGIEALFFAINHYKDEIIVHDFVNTKQSVYNYNAELLRTEDIPFSFTGFIFVSGNQLACFRNFSYDDDFDPGLKAANDELKFSNLLICDPQYNIKQAYLPFDSAIIKRQEIVPGNMAFFSHSGKRVFFHQPYSTEIFSLGDGSLQKQFQFIFTLENSLPSDFLKDRKYLRGRYDYVRKFPNLIYDVSDFYRAGNNITFRIFSTKLHQTFFYNLSSHQLVSLSSILEDKAILAAPFSNGIVASDGKVMITYEKAAMHFKNSLKSGSVVSNPILVKLKLKE